MLPSSLNFFSLTIIELKKREYWSEWSLSRSLWFPPPLLVFSPSFLPLSLHSGKQPLTPSQKASLGKRARGGAPAGASSCWAGGPCRRKCVAAWEQRRSRTGHSAFVVRLKSDGDKKETTWTNEVPNPGSGFVF